MSDPVQTSFLSEMTVGESAAAEGVPETAPPDLGGGPPEAAPKSRHRNSPPVQASRAAASRSESSGFSPEEAADRYLCVREVAHRFSASVQSVWRWTKSDPSFPQPIKLRVGTTRWRLSDLIAFERSFRRGKP